MTHLFEFGLYFPAFPTLYFSQCVFNPSINLNPKRLRWENVQYVSDKSLQLNLTLFCFLLDFRLNYYFGFFSFFILTDVSDAQLGRGRRKKTASLKVSDQSDETEGVVSDSGDSDKLMYKVNTEGRYICYLCKKTFKTVSLHLF